MKTLPPVPGAFQAPRSAHAIGAELHELDPAAIGPGEAAAIRRLVYEHKLLVLRGQDLSDEAYIDLARRLGTPQIYFQPNYHHPEHPEIFVSANVPWKDGQKFGVAGTGRYWHTDYQFFAEPLPLTMVYPRRIPRASRGTHYIDMQRVLRELPAPLAERLRGARAVHEAKWRYKVQASDIDKSITEILEEFGALTPPVTHPAVIRHPVLERECLYVSEGFTVGIEGMSHEQGKALLAEVFAFTQREEHVYTHAWRDGDILLWDNRQLIHKASSTPAGEVSVSYRIGVYDGLSFYAA